MCDLISLVRAGTLSKWYCWVPQGHKHRIHKHLKDKTRCSDSVQAPPLLTSEMRSSVDANAHKEAIGVGLFSPLTMTLANVEDNRLLKSPWTISEKTGRCSRGNAVWREGPHKYGSTSAVDSANYFKAAAAMHRQHKAVGSGKAEGSMSCISELIGTRRRTEKRNLYTAFSNRR